MTDSVPAIALLFDDTELGGQLREALNERGARIVHEGEIASLSRQLLEQVGADVLVVNLDDSAGADDALDHLYDLLDGDRPRVVFNDAQASRALTGWDRARWARHLAVKVLAVGDVDPPRPEDVRGAEPAAVVPAETTTPEQDVVASAEQPMPAEEMPMAEDEPVIIDAAADSDADLEPEEFLVHDADDVEHEQNASAESESLAAELEAMLASGDLPDEDEETTGPGLRYFDGEEPPPLHDGNFGEPAEVEPPRESIDVSALETTDAPFDDGSSKVAPAEFQTDHLQLSALTDADVATLPADAAEPDLKEAPAAVAAPDGWALLDEDAEPAAEEKPEPETFGIQKLSAADFLAPDVESSDAEPTMSLELVSLEEAIAPQAYVAEHDHEMLLDDLGSALSRIVVLGAAVDGIDSVEQFLSALPSTTHLTFLHTQHLGDLSEAVLVERLAARCSLPVRLANPGSKAARGEVLVVPAGQQVRLRRDGNIELQASNAEGDASIDATLTMAASVFGRDALALVFAGRGNDAIAGAQAIHDRGGKVWVESSSGDHFADMVSGIFAERLVSFSGTPPELAAHLIEVFP